LAKLADLADGLPTLVVTHQLQVEHRTGKVCRPETDVVPLCHATGSPGQRAIVKRVCVCVCARTRACVFVLVEDILSALEAASGRKHPSTVQVKQLKTFLPLMPVLRHFVTSPVHCAVLLVLSETV